MENYIVLKGVDIRVEEECRSMGEKHLNMIHTRQHDDTDSISIKEGQIIRILYIFSFHAFMRFSLFFPSLISCVSYGLISHRLFYENLNTKILKSIKILNKVIRWNEGMGRTQNDARKRRKKTFMFQLFGFMFEQIMQLFSSSSCILRVHKNGITKKRDK